MDGWLCPLSPDVQCSQPPDIASGRHRSQGMAVFVSGTSVVHACDPGYVLIGAVLLNCAAAGVWSDPFPQREGVFVTCGYAKDTKGLREMLNLQRLSSLVVNGNSKHKQKQMKKNKNKQTKKTTTQISFPAGELCPSPPVIDHGQHDGKDVDFIPGMSVNYSCDPGYSLTGKAALYCTDNASWSSPQPRCEGELPVPSVP